MAFELFQSEKSGKYYFRLKAKNGQVVLASEAYNEKAGAENGIASVKANTADGDGQFEKKVAKDGSPYFNLKAKNGQVIGKSEMYSSDAACDNGIKSVIANATGDTKDLTV